MMSKHTERAIAYVRLARPTSITDGYVWEVVCCPYCGRQHWHGAGDNPGAVEKLLGSRMPHCLHSSYPEYELVRILEDREPEPEPDPGTAKGKTRWKICW